MPETCLFPSRSRMINTFFVLATLFTFTGFSLAVPTYRTNAGFRGELYRKPQNGYFPAEWFRAMAKYGVKLRPHEERALNDHLARREEGSVVPASLADTGASYQTPVTIGEQSFMLDFDTGSSILWVYSTLTMEVPDLPHTLYDPSNSTTATATGKIFGIEYGDNSTVVGEFFDDTLSIGAVVIQNQAVGAAVNVTGVITTNPSDGLMGLAPVLEDKRQGLPTVLGNLAVGQQLPSPFFTCALTREDEPNGFFTFGLLDVNLTNGKVPPSTPVDISQGFWEFDSTFAIINGKTIQRPKGNTAFADTGTTLILLGDDILPTIYAPLNGVYDPTVPGWIFPSDTPVSQAPLIVLPAGDIQITLDPLDIAAGAVNDSYIFGSIQPKGDAPAEVYGDFWLRNVYAIWNFGTTAQDFTFGAVQRAPVTNPTR